MAVTITVGPTGFIEFHHGATAPMADTYKYVRLDAPINLELHPADNNPGHGPASHFRLGPFTVGAAVVFTVDGMASTGGDAVQVANYDYFGEGAPTHGVTVDWLQPAFTTLRSLVRDPKAYPSYGFTGSVSPGSVPLAGGEVTLKADFMVPGQTSITIFDPFPTVTHTIPVGSVVVAPPNPLEIRVTGTPTYPNQYHYWQPTYATFTMPPRATPGDVQIRPNTVVAGTGALSVGVTYTDEPIPPDDIAWWELGIIMVWTDIPDISWWG